MINFEYIRANSIRAAVTAMAQYPQAKLIAGGTNLVDLMKRGVVAPERLIDINGIDLHAIVEDSGGLRIGALAANSDVADDARVQKSAPLLAMALRAGASAQLRNMATIGGNMMQRTRCSYFYDTTMPCNKRNPGSGCGALKGENRMHAIFGASDHCIAVHPSDMCVALAALDAEITIHNTKAVRTVAFTDFHRLPGTTPERDNNLAPGELITGIRIPPNTFNQHYYLKIRDRASYAFALVSVAVALQTRDNSIIKARLAMGGVAHKPWRLAAVEDFLTGKEPSLANFEKAAALSMTGATGYGGNDFKLKLAPSAIVTALLNATKPQS